jgi:hypothetical protein
MIVRTAIAAEQSLALRMQQMIAMAVLAEPGGSTAYFFVWEEIRRILNRRLWGAWRPYRRSTFWLSLLFAVHLVILRFKFVESSVLI